uniref:DNA-directed DNA polymerase n=1 Tax=Ascaris lumbricoides TaxID=6252 RepID=A0A0M3IWA4_ASCLU
MYEYDKNLSTLMVNLLQNICKSFGSLIKPKEYGEYGMWSSREFTKREYGTAIFYDGVSF